LSVTVKKLLLSLLLPAVLSASASAWALDAQSLARLKKAGVEDATIEAMIRERTVETAAFTVEDIIAMKTAGVGEATLQALICEGSFLKDREPVVYGSELRSVRLTTMNDLVRLKQAGVSDEVLQAIVAVSRRGTDAEREQALRQLQEMGIWVEVSR
jgi:hypothetical protein